MRNGYKANGESWAQYLAGQLLRLDEVIQDNRAFGEAARRMIAAQRANVENEIAALEQLPLPAINPPALRPRFAHVALDGLALCGFTSPDEAVLFVSQLADVTCAQCVARSSVVAPASLPPADDGVPPPTEDW